MNLLFLICILVIFTGTVILGIWCIVAWDFTAGGILLFILEIMLIAAVIYSYPSSKFITEQQSLLRFADGEYVVQERINESLEYTFLYSNNGDIEVLKAKYSKIQFVFNEAETAPHVEIVYHPCLFRNAPAEAPEYIIYLKNSYQIAELIS